MYNTKKEFKKRNPLALDLWSEKYRPRKERIRPRETKIKHRYSYLKELEV